MSGNAKNELPRIRQSSRLWISRKQPTPFLKELHKAESNDAKKTRVLIPPDWRKPEQETPNPEGSCKLKERVSPLKPRLQNHSLGTIMTRTMAVLSQDQNQNPNHSEAESADDNAKDNKTHNQVESNHRVKTGHHQQLNGHSAAHIDGQTSHKIFGNIAGVVNGSGGLPVWRHLETQVMHQLSLKSQEMRKRGVGQLHIQGAMKTM